MQVPKLMNIFVTFLVKYGEKMLLAAPLKKMFSWRFSEVIPGICEPPNVKQTDRWTTEIHFMMRENILIPKVIKTKTKKSNFFFSNVIDCLALRQTD